jgi:hypothetical protein
MEKRCPAIRPTVGNTLMAAVGYTALNAMLLDAKTRRLIPTLWDERPNCLATGMTMPPN